MAKKRKVSSLSIEGQGLERKLVVLFSAISFLPLVLIFGLMLYYAPNDLYKPNVVLAYLFLVILSFSGFVFLKKVVHRLLVLIKGAQTIMAGNLTARINIDSMDEIGELAKVFNSIAEELEENVEKLKASKKLLEEVLMKIGDGLAASSTIDSFLELMVNTITQALDARMGRLLLLTDDKTKLYVKFAVGPGSGAKDGIYIDIGEGIEGWVAKEKKPICLPYRNSIRGQLSEAKTAEPAIICVPLIFKDDVLGVMSIADKYSKEQFTEDDMFILNNIAAQTAIALENMRLNQDVEKTYMETLSALAMAVEAKDPYSRGHSRRVAEISERIAREMGLPDDVVSRVKDAAEMHDIGKIGITDEILHKPGPLNEQEREIMCKHPVIGEGILKPVKKLQRLCDAVRHHHEWLDGSGYPDGLKGHEISIDARILCVADVYDAITSDRPYRKAMSRADAIAEIEKWVGKRYDPEVFKALCKVV